MKVLVACEESQAVCKAFRASLWSVSYKMVNAGIEWTGAGYNGIYEH